MFNDIAETYISDIFPNMWECRNKEGWMIGCGESVAEAQEDTKTYNEMTKSSDNMIKEGF